jgi:hypothetical protein
MTARDGLTRAHTEHCSAQPRLHFVRTPRSRLTLTLQHLQTKRVNELLDTSNPALFLEKNTAPLYITERTLIPKVFNENRKRIFWLQAFYLLKNSF